jgi:hypothetical protein
MAYIAYAIRVTVIVTSGVRRVKRAQIVKLNRAIALAAST